MVLGAINAGLGFELTRAPRSWITAYTVIAAVMYATYAGIKTLAVVRKNQRGRSKSSPRSSHTGYEEHGDEVPMKYFAQHVGNAR